MSNNSSDNPVAFDCSYSSIGLGTGVTYILTKTTLHFPLYTFILYLGVQKWKQKRSFTTASHSDIFTYHLAVFMVFFWLASVLYLCRTANSTVSVFLFAMTWYGENYFQVLTCVEQYLAVVHPIVYRRLRNARGVKIRNISIGFVWFLSFSNSATVVVHSGSGPSFQFMLPFAVCLVVVSFCCVSVLRVLIRPGPGEGSRVDQSKQRAFYTITAIMMVLWLWLGGMLIFNALFILLEITPEVECALGNSVYWFNLPSGSVLPLLYLHRAGKLSFCCHKNG